MDAYWTHEAEDILRRLQSTADGLSSAEAVQRLREYGPNQLKDDQPLTRIGVMLRQLRSPLLLLLVFAAAASALSGEWLDSAIVATIVIATVGIGYSREYSAQAAAAALRARVRVRASVFRDGRVEQVPIESVVPGDVVQLGAGSLVPADGVLLDATDCFIGEAMLTGESFPVEKAVGAVSRGAGLAERRNCVFLGTSVRSGTARAVVTRTGPSTEFGSIAHRLTLRPPETEFDRGIRHFGYLLTSAMLMMVLLVFVAHMFRGRPPEAHRRWPATASSCAG
jgi:Mg2+-importing ATPase